VTLAANDWKRGVLLFAGLICASGMFFLLSFLGVGLLGVEISYPAAYNNIYLAGRFMLVIAIILGLTAIPALILILHSLEVGEARGRLQESR
jgi:threonine/homoserine/homoserine lactone efflux protein